MSHVSLTTDQARETCRWIANRLITHLPQSLEGDDDWGNTKSIWSGVKVRRDGWKVKTNRRTREVRHGRWLRYRIDMPPTPSMAQEDSPSPIQITDVVPIYHPTAMMMGPSNSIEHQGTSQSITLNQVESWQVDAITTMPAKFFVRLERWNLGVQWYSVSITGDMTVRLTTRARFAARPDYTELPPALEFKVNVLDARLAVQHFEVDRISKVGGDVAEELGELAEDTIGKLWLRRENQKLADRLNRAIAKKQDQLRISMLQLLAPLGS